MSDGPEYRLDDQIGFKLRVANQRHLEIFATEMPELTPRQFAVMAKLDEEGTLSQNHLGRLVAMDAATTKGVVDRLVRKGLIAAVPSPTDRRRVEISLTAEGADQIREAIVVAARISERTARNLTPRELARLMTLLDKL
ncbi:MarR family transcriptional regulator [Defluviimonas sp. WL0024]|uniref:MarR family transcriptional regulator n=2 Tax=Albidovulum TaxID=205889 RepID=A0ABT3J0S8_9RHOB|nr:MarR family transcriptional regulator [Defluviimonas sp. WL0024]MCU9847029.1 MarR family transcriptional regulator [Defluviimonas sp. WL0024]MCW3781289.1 MarR family transcriptional regulator [Defluviimonas salinarum]